MEAGADRAKEAVERFTVLAVEEVQAGYDAGDPHQERLGLRLPGRLAGNPDTRRSDTP